MSHSVTTTASYVLHKYSCSYPSTSLQGTQSPAEPEWRHFTNPVMRIILEATKSPSGQLVSMRLRILWSIHILESSDLHTDQREVVFEDLDLLSFSSLPPLQAPVGLQSDQGLPLKAVYRDAVVGIRYLHPRTVHTGSQPTYRRFQITFKNAQDASQFIDAIRPVCPCKANPQPTRINRHSTMLAPSLAYAGTTVSGITPALVTRSTERPSAALAVIDPVAPSTIPGQPVENCVFPVVHASEATNLSCSSDDSAFVTCSETSHRADTQDGHVKDVRLPKHRRRASDSAQSSLPNSSQPPPSVQSSSMPPPPVPQRVAHATASGTSETINPGSARSQLLASLSEHPSLYELSRTELETLVSQVVREEGFLHLLESLDSLWRIKGFLGH